MIEDKKITKPRSQNITIEDRKKLYVTGVIDVESFNEETVIANTELGLLFIHGQDLHINKLNLDNNDLLVEGEIISCEYMERDSFKPKSILGKLLK